MSVANHLGEISKASNGMWMTIVAYRSVKDLDVQFEDGTIVYNKSYNRFKDGKIGYPNRVTCNKYRLGETRLMNCGLNATIIGYTSANDITVKFEDGTVKERVAYSKFKVGQVAPSNYLFSKHIGEVNRANNGLLMKVVAYRGATDIDVQFENNVVRKGVSYSSFKKGEIRLTPQNRVVLGECRVSASGLKYRVVENLSRTRCIIEFEDGVRKEVERGNVSSGSVAHPSQARAKKDLTTRIGETSRHTSGELMTLIDWKGSTNITIQFEDGTVVYNKSYGSFKSGEVSKHSKSFNERVLGEVGIAKNGLSMKIIAVRSGTDIDIEFEDGVVVHNKRYSSFKEGAVAHPDYPTKKDRVGGVYTNKQGIKLTIIQYRCNKDVDVEFEDGLKVRGVNFNTIKNGLVGHPAFAKGIKGGLFGRFRCNGLAYKLIDGSCFYYCQCCDCNKKDILSPTQMLEHICN